MKILVCGGRNYSDESTLSRVLGEIHAATPITEIINGGATGADALAERWARRIDIRFTTIRAKWDTHGYFAGPIRNAVMIKDTEPDLVVAFPGGRGTADMIKKAIAAGVRVLEVPQ